LIDDEQLWRPHRRALDPAFNSSIVQSFLPIFNEKAKICIEGLKQKHVVDPYSLWTPLTLEVFLATSMGLKKDIQGVKNHSFLEDMEQ
jgi:cytochrome P450